MGMPAILFHQMVLLLLSLSPTHCPVSILPCAGPIQYLPVPYIPIDFLHDGSECLAYIAVIPPFHAAVDKAVAYLDPVDGLLGVADFFVSGKHDLPLRQMNHARRFFWRYTSCQAPLPILHCMFAILPYHPFEGIYIAIMKTLDKMPLNANVIRLIYCTELKHFGMQQIGLSPITLLRRFLKCIPQLQSLIWLSRRAIFDTDNIDIGPERRNYLDHRLSRVWEMNGQVGSLLLFVHMPYAVCQAALGEGLSSRQ